MPIHLAKQSEEIIHDIVNRVPMLDHINPGSILVLVHKMSANKHGQNCGLRHARKGRVFEPVFPDVRHKGRDIRYVISLNPRICSVDSPKECDYLETVLHEMWHIGTKCDGAMRRMRHGKRFNTIVKDLAETYRQNDGKEFPLVSTGEKVRTRAWKGRVSPSIAYLRRGPLLNRSRALKKIGWRDSWSEEDLIEKTVLFEKLIPTSYRYQCPTGHEIETHVRYRKPRSCALCSSKFDERFVYKQVK